MKRVLLADDQLPSRQLIAASLAQAGIQIIEASSGSDAWDLLQRRKPDLALLDVSMSGRTGIELTQAIRSDASLADLPVILISSHSDQASIDAGMAAGANLYLTKPFSPRKLLELVRETLGLPD